MLASMDMAYGKESPDTLTSSVGTIFMFITASVPNKRSLGVTNWPVADDSIDCAVQHHRPKAITCEGMG